MFRSSWRRILVSLFRPRVRTIRRRPPVSSRRRLRLEGLEDRITPATLTELNGGTTLLITLDNANEQLSIVSNGATYSYASTNNFVDGGVSNPADFSAFGGLTLTELGTGLARYNAVKVANSAANTSGVFNDSAANTYSDDFILALDMGSAGVTFNGASTFGSSALNVQTDRNILVAPGATVSTTSGGITFEANQQAVPTAGNFTGISIQGIVTSTGSGNLILKGRGGNDAATGSHRGVALFGGTVSSTGTGTITVVGTGGSGTSLNSGVDVEGAAALLTSASGAIDITGVAGDGTADGAIGVLASTGGKITATGTATITISGTGAVGTADTEGFRTEGAGSEVNTVNGNFSITATAGGAVGSQAILLNGGALNSTGVGNVTLIADSMSLAGGTIGAGANTVTLRQKTNGTAINLGTETAGTLSLTDPELDNITAGTIIVGDANTGTVTISAEISRAAAANLNVTSGGTNNIAFDAGSLDANGGNVTLTAGGAITTSAAATDVRAANLTANAATGIDLDTAVTSISASTTGAGAIVLDEADGATLTSITAANGSITITTGGATQVTSVVSTTDNDANDISITTSTGDMTVVTVTAGAGVAGDVTLQATAGSILDDGVNATLVTGDAVGLSAGVDIGAPGAVAMIDTTANSWALSAGGGVGTHGIWATDTNAVIVTSATTTNGVIILASGGAMTASCVTANGTSRTVVLSTTAGDILLGAVSATGNARISAAGAIVDNNDGTTNVTAVGLALQAATGIGSGNALETIVTNVAASNSTSGSIELTNTGALTITSVGPVLGVTAPDVTNTDGAINISATGDLTVSATVTANGTGRNVGLSSTGGSVLLNAAVTATGDQVSVTAGAGINGASTVTAATVDLDAVTGIGNTTALNLAATSISADTTNGNIDLNNAQAAATTVTSLTTGTGTITFDQTGGGSVAFTNATTTNGGISLTNTGADITLTSVSAGGAGSDVQATTTTSGTINVFTVSAADDVTFNAAGSILDDLVNSTVISGDAVSLTAGVDIGAPGLLAMIDTTAASWTLSAGGGTGTHGIWVTDTDDVTVTSATTTDGVILLESARKLTVVTVSAGGTERNVRLLTTAGDIDFGTTGSVSAAGDVVRLQAAGAITESGSASKVTALSLSATASTGIGKSTDALNTTVTNLAASTGTGGLLVTNSGALTVTSLTVFGVMTTGAQVTGASGNIAVVASSPLTVNAIVSGPGDILLQAGNSAAAGDNLTLSANVTSTGGGTIDLTAGDDISQTTDTIQSNGSAGTRLVRFTADNEGAGVADGDRGGISQTGGNILATNLVFRAFEAVSATSATNDAANLAANVGGAGFGFEYRDANALALATVDTLPGIATTGGNATLCLVTGDLSVGQNIAAGAGLVRLQTLAGSITGAGTITGSALGLHATGGSVSLTSSSSDVDTLAATTTGGVAFTDADGFAIGTVLASGCFTTDVTGLTAGGDVELCVTTGDLAINAPISASGQTVRLFATAGNVSQAGTGTISAANLGVAAGQAISLGLANVVTATFAAQAGGAATFDDTNGFSVGSIGAGVCFPLTAGVVTTDGAVNLSVTGAGALTVGTAVNAGGVGRNMSLSSTGGNVLLNAAVSAAGDQATVTAGAAINGGGLVTAATVDLNAVTGIGNATALNLAATTISADTTNGNIDLNNAIAAATTATSLTTGTGTITFDHTGGGSIAFTSATTTNGGITLSNAGADMTLTSVSAGGAGNDVQATTTTSGTINVVTVSAVDDVTLNAAGSILDDGVNATLISGDAVSLTAGVDIGAPGALAMIDTAADSWSLAAAGGVGDHGIWVTDTNIVIVTSASTGDGIIILTSGGTMTANSVAANGMSRSFVLTTTAGDILVGTVSATGNARLSAAGAIVDNNGAALNITASGLALQATTGIGSGIGSGTALETAVTNVAASNTISGDIGIANTGALTVASVGPVEGVTVTGVANTGSNVTLCSNGDLNINAATSTTITVRLSAGGAVAQTAGIAGTHLGVVAGGNIALDDAGSSNNISGNFAAQITGAAGFVHFRNTSAVGFAVGQVSLADCFNGATGVVTAGGGDIALGDAQAGATLTINNAINAGAGIVRLTLGSAVTQTNSALASITSGGLGITSGGNVTLDGALTQNNVTANVAIQTTGGGSFARFRDTSAAGFTVGSVGALSVFAGATGVTTTGGGDIALTDSMATAVLTINNVITAAGAGTVRLFLGSDITQANAANASITAGDLGIVAGGNVTLDGVATTNVVTGNFAANNSGSGRFVHFANTNGGGFAVGQVGILGAFGGAIGVTTIGSGDIILTDAAPGATLTINNVLTATVSDVRLGFGGAVTQTNAVMASIAAMNLGITAVGNVTLDGAASNNIVTGKFAVQNTGAGNFVHFINRASKLTIAPVAAAGRFTGAGGILTNNGAVVLQSARDFTVAFDPTASIIDTGAGTVTVTIAATTGLANINVLGQINTTGGATITGAQGATAMNAFFIRPGSGSSTVINVMGNAVPPTCLDTLMLQQLGPAKINSIQFTPDPNPCNGSFQFNMDAARRIDYKFIGKVQNLTSQVTSVQTRNNPTDSFDIFVSVAAQDAGQVFAIQTGTQLKPVSVNAFVLAPAFASPSASFSAPRVTFADTQGDGFSDLVLANGPGGAPLITVIDGRLIAQGLTNVTKTSIVAQFFAFDPRFMGGLNVAGGVLDNTGKASIVAGMDFNGPPLVRVFAFDATAPNKFVQTKEFMAYDAGFRGGVRVAVGDVNSPTQTPIIVTAPGAGAALPVKVFSTDPTVPTQSFFPYGTNFSGGILVAVANLDDDKLTNDILTGPGAEEPIIKIFRNGMYTTASSGFVAFRSGPGTVLANGFVGTFNANSPVFGVSSVAFGSIEGKTRQVVVGSGIGQKAVQATVTPDKNKVVSGPPAKRSMFFSKRAPRGVNIAGRR